MKKNYFGRLILIIVITLLAVIFYLPSTSLNPSLPEWLQKYGIVLGLDLQGGVHLVYEVDGDTAVNLKVERISASLTKAFKEKQIESTVQNQGLDIIVSPADDKAIAAVQQEFPILKEQTRNEGKIIYRLDDAEIKMIKDLSVDQALETIRNRVDAFGVAEPSIHRQAENELVIELPGVKDTKRAIELVGKTAMLEFKLLDDESQVSAQLPGAIDTGKDQAVLDEFVGKISENNEILFGRVLDKETGVETKLVYLLKKQTLMTGELLTEARVNIDQSYNEPYVSLVFDTDGAKIFEEITGNNVGKRLAIILDNNVYSAPVIKDKIAGGNAQISGSFTMQEAKDLAIVLRSGSLPAPMKMLQNITVGPSLGRDSIDAGLKAGIAAAIIVIIFMITYYKVAGVIADFALVLNIVFLLAALSAFNATLTLPGIAGVILAIGMAVDSNVLMFERIREELRIGKTPRAAIDSGYDKAFWTIFDSHVTTLITSIVLFQYGTGPIKGFAVTLGLGVSINLFTALIGTKTVFDIITSNREVKRLSI